MTGGVAPDLTQARAEAAIAARGGRLGRPLIVLAETESTNDDAKRGALYAKIQQICVEEVAQVAMFHPNWLNGYSPKVKDLILNIGLQFSEIDQTDLV